MCQLKENVWSPLSFITERHKLKCKDTYTYIQRHSKVFCSYATNRKYSSTDFFPLISTIIFLAFVRVSAKNHWGFTLQQKLQKTATTTTTERRYNSKKCFFTWVTAITAICSESSEARKLISQEMKVSVLLAHK